MQYFLNAGFGNPLPPADFELIRALGYGGIRQDVPTAISAPALVENALETGLGAIFVLPVADPSSCQEIAHAVSIRAVEMARSSSCVLEVGNEEDLGGKRWTKDPHGWALLVADVVTIAKSHGFLGPVVSGGISSVSHNAIGWLRDSRVAELEVGIGFHQYRSTPPDKPLDGYHSRGDEYAALKSAAGDRPIWCTESGWSTAPHKGGFLHKDWQFTDMDVANFLEYEIALADSQGARSFVVYQLNDGPDPNNDQDRFGIRRQDGSLKPQANVLLRSREGCLMPAVVRAKCSRCRKCKPCYVVPQIRGLKLCMVCLYWIIQQAKIGLYQLKSWGWRTVA